MNMLSRIWAAVRNKPLPSAPNTAGNQDRTGNTEKGTIADPERSVQYLYDMMQCDPNLRAAIITLRHMDKVDPRVNKLWLQFLTRLQLNNRAKLMSDAGGLAKEGNLPLQWVVNEAMQVTTAIRMPTETIIPIVDQTGRFRNPKKAFRQIDPITWQELCTFPLWQLTVSLLDPDNFDDMGQMGRPYLDANRTI